jgi:hypothetical protein
MALRKSKFEGEFRYKISDEERPYSSSVEFAIREAKLEPITASKLVADILLSHKHYGSGHGGEFGDRLLAAAQANNASNRKNAADWVVEASAFFLRGVRINGRCVIVGLAIADRLVREQLLVNGVLANVSNEKREGASAAEGLDLQRRAGAYRSTRPARLRRRVGGTNPAAARRRTRCSRCYSS